MGAGVILADVLLKQAVQILPRPNIPLVPARVTSAAAVAMSARVLVRAQTAVAALAVTAVGRAAVGLVPAASAGIR